MFASKSQTAISANKSLGPPLPGHLVDEQFTSSLLALLGFFYHQGIRQSSLSVRCVLSSAVSWTHLCCVDNQSLADPLQTSFKNVSIS